MRTDLKHGVWVLAIAGSMSTAAFAADREIKVDDRLDASADTLTDMMRASDKGIPQDLLDKAHCVVVSAGYEKGRIHLRREVWPRVRGMPPERWLGLERPGRDARGRRKCRISDWRFGDRCCVARDERWRNEAPLVR